MLHKRIKHIRGFFRKDPRRQHPHTSPTPKNTQAPRGERSEEIFRTTYRNIGGLVISSRAMLRQRGNTSGGFQGESGHTHQHHIQEHASPIGDRSGAISRIITVETPEDSRAGLCCVKNYLDTSGGFQDGPKTTDNTPAPQPINTQAP